MFQKYLGAAAIAAMPLTAFAQTIVFSGNSALSTENTGSNYSGEMTYDPGQAELTISLSNTTPVNVGGRLTAFVFKIGSVDSSPSASLMSSSNGNFQALASGTSAAPFGNYDAGASIGGGFLGGGNPNQGIAIGATSTFVFTINASDANMLSTSSFLSSEFDFVARFRGLADGGSDNVPSNVPTPGTAALLLGSLCGLSSSRRRR